MAFCVRKLLVAKCTPLSLDGWLLNYFVCYVCPYWIAGLVSETKINKSEFSCLFFFFFPLVRFPFKEGRWLYENKKWIKVVIRYLCEHNTTLLDVCI